MIRVIAQLKRLTLQVRVNEVRVTVEVEVNMIAEETHLCAIGIPSQDLWSNIPTVSYHIMENCVR